MGAGSCAPESDRADGCGKLMAQISTKVDAIRIPWKAATIQRPSFRPVVHVLHPREDRIRFALAGDTAAVHCQERWKIIRFRCFRNRNENQIRMMT